MENTNIYQEPIQLSGETKPKIPSSLNVLTILTFIGCGLGLIFVLAMPALNKMMLGFMDKAVASGEDIPADKLAEMEKGRAVIQLSQANAVPLIAISLLGVALCLWGAIWMRKLKKDGYWIYIGGEILPLVGSFILLGTAQYTGVMSVILGVGIPLIFVILYTMQRKYLVY